MGLWGAAIQAGGALGSAVIKSQGQTDPSDEGDFVGAEASPGFHGGGNASLGKGALKDARAGGMGRLNNFLGTPAGVLTAQVGGQFLGDYRQRRNSRNRFKDLKNEGLTPQEIAGSSGGGAVQATGNTLGSGPQQQAAHQQAFQADQAQKERDNKLNIAKIQTQPAARQATVSEGRFGLQLNLHPKVMQQIYAQVEKLEVDIKRANIDIENIWPMRFSQMSPENGMFSLAAFARGIDLKRVLEAKGDITEEEWEQTVTLYNDFIKITSGSTRNLLSLGQLFNQIVEGQDTLTNPKIKKIGTGKIIKNMGNPDALKPWKPSFGRVWR